MNSRTEGLEADVAPQSNVDNVLVIIPALNEESTISEVLQTLQAHHLYRIRVVDNGSCDRTFDIAFHCGTEVISESRRGYGQACWRGLQDIPANIDWILFCDGDGSDDLSPLPDFLALRDSYDFILGNRRGTETGQQNLTPAQNFGNGLATALLKGGWGYSYQDLGPLRLIRKEALEHIDMQDRGFGWTVEMQAKAIEAGLRIRELPVNYRPRQGGQSKISGTLSGSFKAGTIILTTIARLYRQSLWRQTSLPPSEDKRDLEKPLRPQAPLRLLSTFCLILGSLWILPHGDFLNAPEAVPNFWWGIGIMGLGFIGSWGLRHISGLWFWGVAVTTRLLLLAMAPGDDIWRYLWEGYIQTAGFSPYELAPNAEILTALRPDWWGNINHPDVSAIYPPVAQFGFRLLAAISPSVLLFKLALTAADLGICGLLSHRFGHRASLLYAWNPLIIYSFAGGGHYDSWFLLPLVAAWLWFERSGGEYPGHEGLESQQANPLPPLFDWLGSAFLVGISIAIKWMSLPLLGFLAWQGLKRGKLGLTLAVFFTGLVPFALAAIPFCTPDACPLIPTGSVFVSYGRSAEFIPHIVSEIWPPSRWHNSLYALPLALMVGWLLLRTHRFQKFAEWYFMGLLLLSPIIHGWYFTWVVPFGVASRNLGIRLVSLSAFVYFALPYNLSQGNGSWVLEDAQRQGLWWPFIIGIIVTAGLATWPKFSGETLLSSLKYWS